MVDNLEQQRIADMFNNAISKEKEANMVGTIEKNADSRRAAIYALQRFEAAGWYPQALDQAISEFPTANLDFVNLKLHASLDELREILERYIDIVEEGTGVPAIENEMFTARHASWYVARQLTRRGTQMTYAGIDKHIRVNKDLRGQMAGTSMIFTRQQLDEYVKNFDKMPRRGRPAATPIAE